MTQELLRLGPAVDADVIARALGKGQGVQLDLSLTNDLGEAGAVVEEHSVLLSQLAMFDAHEVKQVRLALEEAVANAIMHGNLEIDKSLREVDYLEWMSQLKSRPMEPRYVDRRVKVTIRLGVREVEYEIGDDGQGFDVAALPAKEAQDAVTTCGGRGLMLMRSAMDVVSHNSRGNRLTLIKRRRVETGKPDSSKT